MRIVRGKYIETKKMKSVSAGLEKLLNEHILPTKDTLCTWQSFREKHLWEYRVNELLEANLDLIQRLYDHLQTKKTKTRAKTTTVGRSKFLSYHNLVEHIFEASRDLGVARTAIQSAFILSKMTVEQENEDGPRDYNQIKFVEFLEFIGRLAWFKFKDDP